MKGKRIKVKGIRRRAQGERRKAKGRKAGMLKVKKKLKPGYRGKGVPGIFLRLL